MKRRWTIPELIDQWALSEAERALVDAAREPHTRLGCACLLKYFQLDWRFPRGHADVPDAAIAHLAHQLGVPASSVLQYDWEGRTATHHRAAIRTFLGVREASVADQQAVTDWLAAQVSWPRSPSAPGTRRAAMAIK